MIWLMDDDDGGFQIWKVPFLVGKRTDDQTFDLVTKDLNCRSTSLCNERCVCSARLKR